MHAAVCYSDQLVTSKCAPKISRVRVAMLLVAYGRTAWGWTYAGYTSFNAITAWLILTRRI